MQVTFNLSDSSLLRDIDRAAKERNISRSRFISDCLHAWFAPKEPSTNEVALLQKDIQRLNELMAAREAEIAEAKEMSGRYWLMWKECNDRLVQYQLPAPTPRRGFWSWLRRGKR
jgi:hypothetical protein